MQCPNCSYNALPEGSTTCPQCGQPVSAEPTPSTQIKVDQQVDLVSGDGQVVGVSIDQVSGSVAVGYSVSEVQTLLDQVRTTFQPRPFDGRSPYVGLETFQEEDAERFFGREKLVAELVEELRTGYFALVAGPSGSGKSSLVRAGLLPALKKGALPGSERWLYAALKPGRSPLEALGRAVASIAGSLTPLEDLRQRGLSEPGMLHEWLEVALGDQEQRRALIFVDQFEEVFTQLSQQEEALRAAFIAALTHAAKPQGRVIILLTMRSDFIANCAAYPELNSLLNQGFLQVGAMQPDELVSAIARPALEVGLRIDPELVTQVIYDMREEPGALPLMQFAMQDLFNAQASQGGVIELTLDGYLKRGGLQRALERYADTAFNQLSADEQEMARGIFKGLVQPGRGTQDTRRTALFEELIPPGHGLTEVEIVLRKLADARLITTEDRDDLPGEDRTATLAHERLLEAWPWLRRLVEENREVIAQANQIAEDAQRWESNGRDESYLYSGARLAAAQEGLENGQLALGGLPLEFVNAASQRQQAERMARRQRNQRTLVGLSAAVVIFALLAGIAIIFWRQAQASAHVAAEQAGAAAALLKLSQERGTEVANERSQAVAARATADFNASVAQAQEEEALRQATLALSRQLASQALSNLLSGEIDTALLLAAHAFRTADTPQARSALLATIQENPRLVNLLTGQHDFILDLVYSPDGRLLASGGCAQRDLSRENCLRGELRVWDPASGRLLAALGDQFPEIHTNAITSLAFSPNGRYLASGDRSGQVVLWDAASLQPLAAPLGEIEEAVGYLSFNADSTLLTTRDGQAFQSWELDTRQVSGSPFGELPGGQTPAAISADWSRMAIQFPDDVIIWDTEISSEVTRLSLGSQKEPAGFLTFSPDGSRLAYTQGSEAYVASTTGAEISTLPLQGHTDRITRLAFAPNSPATLASGGWDTTIRIWDVQSWPAPSNPTEQKPLAATQVLYEPLTGHSDYITNLVFSPDGKILASGSRDTTIRLWNWGGPPSLAETYYQHTDEVFSPTYTPDGSSLAFAACGESAENGEDCLSSEVWLLEAASGTPDGEPLTDANNLLTNLAINPRGTLLAAAGWEGKIYIWDLATRQLSGEPLSEHTDFVTGVSFSPDGSLLASASRDGQVLVWDMAERRLAMDALRGHSERITSLDFSPIGNLIASGGRDQMLILWDIDASPVISNTLTGHSEQINVVRFSPDGSRVASGSADGKVILWDVAGLARLQIIQAHNERLSALAFSPDGKLLATGSWDRSVQLWDVETGQPIGGPLNGHSDTVNGLAFSPDGATLLSSSRDGVILRWAVNPEAWIERACRIAARALTEDEWRSFAGANIPYSPACPAP